jgi:hypothetical protein
MCEKEDSGKSSMDFILTSAGTGVVRGPRAHELRSEAHHVKAGYEAPPLRERGGVLTQLTHGRPRVTKACQCYDRR